MMKRKARSFDFLGKLSAFSMAIVILLSIFTPMLSGTMSADAATGTVKAGEAFIIHLDSSASTYWSGSVRVRFTDSGGNTMATQSITAPAAGGTVTVVAPSEAAGATNIVVENLDDTRAAIKAQIDTLAAAAPAGSVLVLYGNESSNWSSVYLYAWKNSGGTTNKNAAWPGVQMTQKVPTTTNLYYAYINPTTFSSLIFSQNGSSQTADLSTPTSNANNLYDSAVNGWTTYSDVANAVTLSVASRAGDNLNHLYLTGERTAAWSKYDGAPTELKTIYFKPTAAWSNAYVTYDDDDPYSGTFAMTQYTPDAENPDAPLIFTAQVPVGAKLTFSNGTSSHSGVIYNGDENYNAYIQSDRQWDTLEKALTSASTNVDYIINDNNFATAISSVSGGKVVGVKATYFDYLSNNELTKGWRNELVDDNYSDNYRKQFSTFNDLISSVAKTDTAWRYPLFFGDDYNSGFYINGYYNDIKDSRTITEQLFYAANNSGGLTGGWNAGTNTERSRSVLGLVNDKLSGGNLMVTDNTFAPWFNNDLLKPIDDSSDDGDSGDSGDQTITVTGPASDEIWIESTVKRIHTWTSSGVDLDLTKLTKVENNGTTYYIVKTSDLQTNFGWEDANGTWKGDYVVSSYQGNAYKADSTKVNISGTCTIVGGSTSTTAPATNEVWVQTDVTWLQFGNGSTWDTTQHENSLPTKTGSDGLTYYVITQSDVGSYTYIGFNSVNNGGFKTFKLSDYWGKAIWNTGDINTTLSSSGGGSVAAGQYAKIIDSYFPFVAKTDASTGVTTYSFNSSNPNNDSEAWDNVYFDWSNGEPTKVNYSAGADKAIKNKSTNGKTYGIFPFNNAGDTARNYGFGIKMEMEFTLPMNGVYGESSSVTPPSVPDDQVWVETGIFRFDSWGNGDVKLDQDALGKLTTTEYNGTTFYVISKSNINSNPNFGFHSEGENNKWYGNLSYGKAYYKDGTEVGGTSGSNHAMFNYTGDDDLWVFIDGQLVLDLGGAHTPSSGSIDFGAGVNTITSTASSVYAVLNAANASATSGSSGSGSTDNPVDGASITNTFSINNTDPARKHTMTVFYMERGLTDSNLSVSFSIQPVENDLSVEKDVEIGNVNSGIADAVSGIAASSDFDFALSDSGVTYSDKSYTLTDAEKNSTTKTTTEGPAQFTLKQDYIARFTRDLTYGDAISITENSPSAFTYDTSYVVTDNKTDETIASSTGATASFNLVNRVNGTGSEDDGASVCVVYTNTLKTANLTLDKTLYKEDGLTESDNNVAFEYLVELDLDGDGVYETYNLDYTINGGTTKYTATGGKVSFRPNQTICFTNIPVGAKYRVTESTKAGYEIKSINGTDTTTYSTTGTIAENGSQVVYANKEKPASSGLQAQKKLDNVTYTGTDFSFSAELIRRDGGATIADAQLKAMYGTDGISETTTVDNNGYISFADFSIVASAENAGKYVFKITEAATPADSLYVYDSTVYYAVIEATEGAVATPVYYKDVNCTELLGSDGKTAPTFYNTTATKYTDVSFTKTADNGTSALAGAEFTLYTDVNCTTQATEATVSKAGLGFVNPATSAETTGVVTFKQLKYEPGQGGATYYFKETKAPNGYQLLTGTFTIDIDAQGEYTIKYDGTELSKNASGSYIVKNIKQPDLPVAGGMGVTMLYVFGAVAVIGAGTAFILYRKRINVIALAKQLIHRK